MGYFAIYLERGAIMDSQNDVQNETEFDVAEFLNYDCDSWNEYD